MKIVALFVAFGGAGWCFDTGWPWASIIPLLIGYSLWTGASDRKYSDPYTRSFGRRWSPDTTFADEGDYEDVPFNKAETAWLLDYRDVEGDESKREVTLKALRKKHGQHYYLLAFCHERKAMRSFRLDRIITATSLASGEVFEDPDILLKHLTARPEAQSPVKGKRIAIYGPLSKIQYAYARETIEALGATACRGNVTKNLDFVIVGESVPEKKLKIAKKNGAKIVSEAQWLEISGSAQEEK